MWDAKEPTPLFEKSRRRRRRWCGQPLWVLGFFVGMAPPMVPMSTVCAHALWAGLCPEKAGKAGKI